METLTAQGALDADKAGDAVPQHRPAAVCVPLSLAALHGVRLLRWRGAILPHRPGKTYQFDA